MPPSSTLDLCSDYLMLSGLLLRAEQLADEIKELQGEMADYNTVS